MASDPSAAPWRRQASGDGGMSPPIGMAPPPPPPPPPPMGSAPAQRLKCEIPAVKEPPACVQNAMMTKDKKPFTYTPGGLDLSQIRSPRMARRLTRNAQSEGVSAGPQMTVPQNHQQQQPQQQNLQPQQNNVDRPISPQRQPVLPAPPPPPPPPPSNQSAAVNRPHVMIPPPAVQQFQQQNQQQTPSSGSPGSARGSLYVPPLDSPISLNKAPTPWLTRGQQQPQNEQQSPPWARQQQMQQQQMQSPQNQSPMVNQHRHVQSPGTPPVTNSVQRQASMPGSPRSVDSPTPSSPLVRQVPTPSVAVHTPQSPYWQPPPPRFPPQVMNEGAPQGQRVIPVQIEVVPNKQVPPSPQYQQQKPQYQQPPSYQQHQQQRMQNSAQNNVGQQNSGPVTRIIPIQIESDSTDDSSQAQRTNNVQQNQRMNQQVGKSSASPRPMFEDAPSDQMRRMHLSDEDQALMGRVKQQVDGEVFLHGEETDPRYRGAAIPSRAFRMLQTMTDPYTDIGAPANLQQNGGPRFGRGPNSAIPSRSFQMLQAMVSDPSALEQGTNENDGNYLEGQEYLDENYLDWYYNLSPEAMAAAHAYWAAVDPNYYYYYQDPYYYDYQYYYDYDPYYDYYENPYMTESEYDQNQTQPSSECPTPSVEETDQSSAEETDKNSIAEEIEKSNKSVETNIGLQAIRSVSNIHKVYDKTQQINDSAEADSTDEDSAEEAKDSQDDDDTCTDTEVEEERFSTPTNKTPPQKDNSKTTPESDSETSEVSETSEDSSEEDEGMITADEHVPHQLSVIFEEPDHSIRDPSAERTREASESSESDISIAEDTRDLLLRSQSDFGTAEELEASDTEEESIDHGRETPVPVNTINYSQEIAEKVSRISKNLQNTAEKLIAENLHKPKPNQISESEESESCLKNGVSIRETVVSRKDCRTPEVGSKSTEVDSRTSEGLGKNGVSSENNAKGLQQTVVSRKDCRTPEINSRSSEVDSRPLENLRKNGVSSENTAKGLRETVSSRKNCRIPEINSRSTEVDSKALEGLRKNDISSKNTAKGLRDTISSRKDSRTSEIDSRTLQGLRNNCMSSETIATGLRETNTNSRTPEIDSRSSETLRKTSITSDESLRSVDRLREPSVFSEDDSSTTIAVESDVDLLENEEETVTVRLPLRFKVTKTEDEEVTTVIVGDQVMDSDISVTVSIPSPVSRQNTSNSISEQTVDKSDSDSDTSDTDDSEDSDESEVVSIRLPKPKVKTEEEPVSVKDRIRAIENGDCGKSLPSDPEEKYHYDEDEVDSGVTSQTDTESDFNELRKCGSYKRAATHSRLYRLLQGKVDDDEDDDEDFQEAESDLGRRPNSLSLKSSRSSVPDSFPSSGIASPASTPPRRPLSTIELPSGASTPGGTTYSEPYSDYSSYYSSWDERKYMSPTVFLTPARKSPFPIAIPRCPMTPCPGDAS